MIEIQIEMAGHALTAQVPALPSKGDAISCGFPASGIPRLALRVTDVRFRQPSDKFEGKQSPDPFVIVITVDADPDDEHAADVFQKALEASPEGQAAKRVREEFAKARSEGDDD